jgi:hypothetical protein
MKYTNADLTRWLAAANAALAENDIECVATSREGRGEIRTPIGGIVTAWTSGKVSAQGNRDERDEVMEVLKSADLLAGWQRGAEGGMLLKMPAAEPPQTASSRASSLETPRTDHEVLEALKSDTPLNKARRAFSSWSAKIEQAGSQRRPLDPIDWRRMEFEAVAEIAAALAGDR